MPVCEVKIVKLNNLNYSNWKFKMELILLKKNLWKRVIKGDRPIPIPTSNTDDTPTNAKVIEEWDEDDDQARTSIGLALEDHQLVHIRNKTTAKEAWNALKDYHEKDTLTNKVHLMRAICSLKLNNGGNVQDHINHMQDLFMKLRDIGEEQLSEEWSVAIILSSLPSEYDTLITALETRPAKDLTFALVQQKVIAEYDRRLHTDISNDSVLPIMGRENVSCYFCQKSGHKKRNSINYKQLLEKEISSCEIGEQEAGNTENKVELERESLSNDEWEEDFLF